MSAAELLRGLDKAATAGPWDYETHRRGDGLIHQIAPVKNALGQLDWSREVACTADGNEANARLIATTRNLLPLLAGLAEAAVAFDAADAAVRAKQDEADLDLLRRCEPGWFANRDALKSAIAALEAAAAKEGV